MPLPLRRTALACCWLTAVLTLDAPVSAQEARPAAPAAAAEPADPRFDILEFQIEDNTVLTVRAIEAAVTPFLGESRTMKDVDGARAALEKAYQLAGFLTVFVDVPEQRVDDGLVRLRVTEGRVDRLKVTGSRYFSQGYIREKLPELAEGRVPNFTELQTQLASVNRSEDRRVQPVLRPGVAPGTVDIDLKVEDRLPLASSIELNNHHSANTEAMRLIATLRYDNLFQRDHGLAITAITAPQRPSQSKVLTATYTVPRDGGATWTGYALWSDSALEPLGATTVLGKGFTLGLRYVTPLPGPANQYHTLALGADYKDLRERTTSAGSDELSTPLRYLPFSAAYSGTWQGAGGGLTQANMTFTFAVARLLRRFVDCPGNVGPVDQFACKRQGADGGFSTLRVDLRHREPLSTGGALALRAGGQLATQPLAGGEQFAAGGADSVRGYYEGEASGDLAVFGSLEWQSRNAAEWLNRNTGGVAKPWFAEATMLGFVDVARVDTLQPLPGQARRVGLAGTGVGLRVRAAKAMSLEADLAWPLRRTDSTPNLDPRLHLKLALKF